MLNIQKNISLASHTAFKIGGPAKFFIELDGEEALLEALNYAKENNLSTFILGGGNNILVSDEGFNGLVIRILDTKYRISDNEIECGAGLALFKAVKLAGDNSLSGLEWATGIPGTIGGAVSGNAGAYGSDMGNIIKSVKVIKNNKAGNFDIRQFDNAECQFEYRNSIFKKNPDLIAISAVLELAKGEKEAILEKTLEIGKIRAGKLSEKPSAGSVFKNPIVKKEDIIACFIKDGGKMDGDTIPAGWLIEEAGLKGKKMGGAAISEKHANIIINNGTATAQDIISLISLIKMKVRDCCGVELKEEIKYVGF